MFGGAPFGGASFGGLGGPYSQTITGTLTLTQAATVHTTRLIHRSVTAAQSQVAARVARVARGIMASQDETVRQQSGQGWAAACGQGQQGRLGQRVLRRTFGAVAGQGAVTAAAISATVSLTQAQQANRLAGKFQTGTFTGAQGSDIGITVAVTRTFAATGNSAALRNMAIAARRFLEQSQAATQVSGLGKFGTFSAGQTAALVLSRLASRTFRSPQEQSTSRAAALARSFGIPQAALPTHRVGRQTTTTLSQAQTVTLTGTTSHGRVLACLQSQDTGRGAVVIARTFSPLQPMTVTVARSSTGAFTVTQRQIPVRHGLSSRSLITILTSDIALEWAMVGRVDASYITDSGIDAASGKSGVALEYSQTSRLI